MQVLMRWNYNSYQAFLIKIYKLFNKTEPKLSENKTATIENSSVCIYKYIYIHIHTNKRSIRDKIAFLYTKELSTCHWLQALPWRYFMQLLWLLQALFLFLLLACILSCRFNKTNLPVPFNLQDTERRGFVS